MVFIYIYVTLSIYIFKKSNIGWGNGSVGKELPQAYVGYRVHILRNHPKVWWAWPMICNLSAQEAETRVLE